MKNHIGVMVVILAVSAGVVKAEPSVYHCSGFNYVYDGGIGEGEPKRIAAKRKLIIDVSLKTAEIDSGDGFRSTELLRRPDGLRSIEFLGRSNIDTYTLEGYFPVNDDTLDSAVRGIVFEYLPDFSILELKYDLDGGRRFLAFTGICS